MKILYYSWGEWMCDDVVGSLRTLGHRVEVFSEKASDYDNDPIFSEKIGKKLQDGYDAVFTMDYFPVLSKICMERRLLYLAWVSDCPHLTLYSGTVKNPCNHIFSFDMLQTTELHRRGANVRYLPLGVNTERLNKQLSGNHNARFDVSFVGSLYQDEHNYLDQMDTLSERQKGYIDGLVEAQLLIYGYDLVGECFGKEEILALARLAPVDFGTEYDADIAELYRDWIRKKVTVVERERMLRRIAKDYQLSLAAPESPGFPDDGGIRYIGYLDYYREMPFVFRDSKINLNFTLRSILHGIPLRVVDVLGAGGFLISNYQPDFENYFQNGREIVWYESMEELLELIGFYLEHDEERLRIAERGRKTAEQIFDYQRLLTEMFQSL